jgi:hypothetical protein
VVADGEKPKTGLKEAIRVLACDADIIVAG